MLRFPRFTFLLGCRRLRRIARGSGPSRLVPARFKTMLMARRTLATLGRSSVPKAFESRLSPLWPVPVHRRLLTRGFWARPILPALQMMQQSGGNVRRAEAFFEQPFNQLVLTLVFATPERRANLLQHDVCTSLFHFHNRR